MRRKGLLQCLSGALLVAAIICCPFSFGGEKDVPSFASFPAGKSYKDKHAPVVLDTKGKRQFRTRLRESEEYPVNFAGEYVVVTWRCGTSCGHGAAVSARTGQVVFLPGSFTGWMEDSPSIEYRPDSRLMVLRGYINEEGIHGIHFYHLSGGVFRLLKVIPVDRYSGIKDDDAVK